MTLFPLGTSSPELWTDLTEQIISADLLSLFYDIIIAGAVIGLLLGIVVKATWWLWR